MRFDSQLFELTEKKQLADGIFDFTVKNGELSAIAQAGQFAHIAVKGKTLRRPISICDASGDCLRLVFQIKGEGTQILADTKPGEKLDILAPLGNGFKIEKGKRYAFIGGGIGVPPMLYSAKQAENPVAILGFRSKAQVILTEDFKAVCKAVTVTTDDGSFGEKGFVTDALKNIINEIDEVCACGPTPMLRSVAALCKENGKPCQVSLEERMGCGIGACLVCACKVKRNGQEGYLHVCKDGPVFNAEEVMW
ncbi:MAG: dihydroorotate dehydrogenase electron transfer subunit [Acutalibacteraceae bacterium]